MTFLLFFAVSEEISALGFLEDLGVAVIECEDCTSAKMGYPNDEGLPEHPFYPDGLADGAAAYSVSESAWLADVETQVKNSRDRIWGGRGMNPTFSKRQQFHFIVPLKEGTFECLAGGLQLRGYFPTFDEAFNYVLERFREH